MKYLADSVKVRPMEDSQNLRKTTYLRMAVSSSFETIPFAAREVDKASMTTVARVIASAIPYSEVEELWDDLGSLSLGDNDDLVLFLQVHEVDVRMVLSIGGANKSSGYDGEELEYICKI